MNQLRSRTAVTPLRRDPTLIHGAADGRLRPTVDELVAAQRPTEPLHCLRPAVVEDDARRFVEGFPVTCCMR